MTDLDTPTRPRLDPRELELLAQGVVRELRNSQHPQRPRRFGRGLVIVMAALVGCAGVAYGGSKLVGSEKVAPLASVKCHTDRSIDGASEVANPFNEATAVELCRRLAGSGQLGAEAAVAEKVSVCRRGHAVHVYPAARVCAAAGLEDLGVDYRVRATEFMAFLKQARREAGINPSGTSCVSLSLARKRLEAVLAGEGFGSSWRVDTQRRVPAGNSEAGCARAVVATEDAPRLTVTDDPSLDGSSRLSEAGLRRLDEQARENQCERTGTTGERAIEAAINCVFRERNNDKCLKESEARQGLSREFARRGIKAPLRFSKIGSADRYCYGGSWSVDTGDDGIFDPRDGVEVYGVPPA